MLNISTLITPIFTNCYFTGQYSNCKIVFELLNVCYEVKIPHIMILFASTLMYDSYLSCLMSFYEVKTMLFQNNLMNNAANCEICRKIITHAKYSANYSKPTR